jgi:hypothetical protein
MFSITVLSKRMQVDDALLCLISISSKFVGSIWTAFVQTDIEMYLGNLFYFIPFKDFFHFEDSLF